MNESIVSLLVPIPAALRRAVRIEAARNGVTMAHFVQRSLERAVSDSADGAANVGE